MVAIEFKNISLSYGSKKVLQGLTFQVDSGKINVLLGPNGAGKTSALQIILGLLKPENGEVFVFGAKPEKMEVKRAVGYVPQDLSFPGYLTSLEVLDYAHHIHHLKRKPNLVTQFGLQDFINTKANQLSGGQKRRLGLALAMCAEPRLLILDEPTTGLDLESKVWFWQFLKNYAANGGTALLTTHDIYEVSAMNCEGLLLNAGRTVASGSMDFLLSKAKYKKLSFRVSGELKNLVDVEKAEQDGEWVRCWTREPEKVIKQLVSDQVHFTDLQIERGSLEEVLQAMGGNLK